jgi:hypothetical protein
VIDVDFEGTFLGNHAIGKRVRRQQSDGSDTLLACTLCLSVWSDTALYFFHRLKVIIVNGRKEDKTTMSIVLTRQ